MPEQYRGRRVPKGARRGLSDAIRTLRGAARVQRALPGALPEGAEGLRAASSWLQDANHAGQDPNHGQQDANGTGLLRVADPHHLLSFQEVHGT